MLNKNNERELAYVARVTEIVPIEGAERVEIAKIQGWTCMVAKGAFKVGDLGVFFEADSKLPAAAPYHFLEKKGYKVKVQKYFKGTVVSDGLLMSASDFGWYMNDARTAIIEDNVDNPEYHEVDKESGFLTERLGVKYSILEDNKRKANTGDKYKKMAQRHGKLFAKQPFRWLMKRMWGKKLLFIFFGKKKDKNEWPFWVVKTDEERCQNLVHKLPEYSMMKWYATEKIDGSSATFTMKKRGGFKKEPEYHVCSRNVVFDDPSKSCYYDTNIYLEMAEKYNMKDVLFNLLWSDENLDFVTIQGEVYGDGVQKRNYSIKDHDLAVFNLIFGYKDGFRKRLNPYDMTVILEKYNVPCVPIVSNDFKIPVDCDELLKLAQGSSKIDGLAREGLVFRAYDGTLSFKAVDNEFIMQYHK